MNKKYALLIGVFLLLFAKFSYALPSPIMFYPLNNSLEDYGVNGYDFTGAGSIAFTTDKDGTANSALAFDGSDDYVYNNHYAVVSPTTTFCLWLQRDENSWNSVFLQGGHDSNDRSIDIRFTGTDQLGFYYSTTAASSYQGQYVSDADLVKMGTSWTHICIVRNGSNAYLYLNGTSVTFTETGGDTNAFREPTTATYNFGTFKSSADYRFDGKMDEIRIYNVSLNSTQVEELYLLGVSAAEETTSHQINVFDHFNDSLIEGANVTVTGGLSNLTDSLGKVIFYGLNDTISFNVSKNGYFSGSGEVAENATVNISLPRIPVLLSPSNDSHVNDVPLSFVAEAFNLSSASCNLVLNGSIVNTTTHSTGNMTLSYTVPEGGFSWFVNCSQTNLTGQSSVFYGVMDTTNPVITLEADNFFSSDNTTALLNNSQEVTINITFSDVNLFAYEAYGFCGDTLLFNQSETDLDATTANYTAALNVSAWPYGDCYAFLSASDDHTSTSIDDYDVSKDLVTTELLFSPTKEEHISVKLKSSTAPLLSLDTVKLTDRYNFLYSFDADGETPQTYVFKLQSPSTIYLREKYLFPSFVINDYWVDFNLKTDAEVKYDKVKYVAISNSYEITIITTENNLVFESIGGLNIVEENYTFTIAANPAIPIANGSITCVYNREPTPETQEFLCTITNASGKTYNCYGLTSDPVTGSLLDVTPRQTLIGGVGAVQGLRANPASANTQSVRLFMSNKRVKENVSTTYEVRCASAFETVSYEVTLSPLYQDQQYGMETAANIFSNIGYLVGAFFFFLFVGVVLFVFWRVLR